MLSRMMKPLSSLLLFVFSVLMLNAQTVPSPESYLGYKVGTQFTRHHQIVGYFNTIAQAKPDMVKIMPYGKTNEGRDLMVAVIGLPENIVKLEAIRKHNNGLVDGSVTDMNQPTIVWLSYNVHGNEPSSSEAALLTLFALVDPANTNTKEWLKYAQEYVKQTPNASYGTFGKLVNKVGEFSQLGPFVRANPKINFNSDSVKTAVKNKNDEKELVAAVHKDVADSIAKADKKLGFPDKNGKNGPHTQAYLTVVMHSMHFDLMVENFDKRLSALTGIRASSPADFRECLEVLSGYKRNPKHSEEEHRKSLNKHLLEKCKINPQTRAIEITDKTGTKVLAEDTWRTAGTSQKVEKKLGGSLRECISAKVDVRQKQRRQVEKRKRK